MSAPLEELETYVYRREAPFWVRTEERLPDFTRRVPFITTGESAEFADWHSGWLTDASLFDPDDDEDDPERPWWCETCREWIGDVEQWYDLPLPLKEMK